MDQEFTNKEFAKLVSQLGDLADLDETVEFEFTAAHLSDYCDLLSTLASHVNRYITYILSPELEQPSQISASTVLLFISSYDQIATLMDRMCSIVCGEESDEDEICDECQGDEDGNNN